MTRAAAQSAGPCLGVRAAGGGVREKGVTASRGGRKGVISELEGGPSLGLGAAAAFSLGVTGPPARFKHCCDLRSLHFTHSGSCGEEKKQWPKGSLSRRCEQRGICSDPGHCCGPE